MYSPVYTSNFYWCDKFYLFASVRPVYTSNLYLKTNDWRRIYGWHQKNYQFYMCCLVYTDNFLYVTIIICHIKTNTPLFQLLLLLILLNTTITTFVTSSPCITSLSLSLQLALTTIKTKKRLLRFQPLVQLLLLLMLFFSYTKKSRNFFG